ncbi:MAG: hypothetical protein ACRYFZ_18215 [Janthinobacterium lividum]
MPLLRLSACLLTSLCLLTGTSCKKNSEPAPPDDTVAVSYAQTQCADKWGFTRDNQQLQTLAIAYLAQQNIALSATQATQTNLGGVCAACTCPTGVVLMGKVPTSQLAAVQALGFTKL